MPALENWWYSRDQRTRIGLAALLALILCTLVALALSALGGAQPETEPTDTPLTAVDPDGVASATPDAAVPTQPAADATAASTDAPEPTSPPTWTPTSEPSPTPSPTPSADDRGDVTAYQGGEPVEDPPPGVDIRTASIGADLYARLHVQDSPAELADWADEGEVLLWLALYDAIPDEPEAYMEWLFALDLDGDPETGRPVGSARINPDLGMEAALGVYYDPLADEPYGAFLVVWDPVQGGLVPKHGALRFTFDESRTLVGLAIPLASFSETVAETADVTVIPEAARGRAAALHGVGEARILDLYPDGPDR